jgi:hypothetical protein
MIISFRRKFIFIRTHKTASSTIETVLRQSLESDDICVRKGRLSHPGGELASLPENGNVAGHMKAEHIAKLVPESFWAACFKFTAERHPYEKAVSLAHYSFVTERSGEGDFAEFLDFVVQRGGYRSFDHYAIEGRVVVDDFIRHESLVADMDRICQRIGFPLPEVLPRKKMKFRTDRRPAREILSSRQKRQVFERCREEFELFGYET